MNQPKPESRTRISITSKTRNVFRRPILEIGVPQQTACNHVRTRLLGLPGEIRNLIYEYLFYPVHLEDYFLVLQLDPHFGNGMAILRTCRLIYHEARALAYASFTPLLSPFDSMLSLDLDQLGQTRRKRQLKPPLDLVKRVTVQQFLFYGLYPWWKLPTAGLLPEELVVQVCICTKLPQLYNNPSQTMHLCDTLERAAADVKSIRRIIVYYCGCEWPEWLSSERKIMFPQIMASAESTHGSRLEPLRDTEDGGQAEQRENVQTLELLPESERFSAASDTDERHYVLTGEHVSTFVGRDVAVDFCDSMTVCGKPCVRFRAVNDLQQRRYSSSINLTEPSRRSSRRFFQVSLRRQRRRQARGLVST